MLSKSTLIISLAITAWDTTKHAFFSDIFFVLTKAKSRAKSPIAQKASMKKECLVVFHPV